MPMHRINDYGTDEEIVAGVARLGSLSALAHERQIKLPSFRSHVNRQEGLSERVLEATRMHRAAQRGRTQAEDFADGLHEHLKRKPKSDRPTVFSLADELDSPPSRIREALASLREQGYRIPDEEEDGGTVALQKIAPAKRNLHRSLLKGDEITVGIAADTHLCSKEHAAGALELAYDEFLRRGITEVWHPGDLVAGRGVYRTQDQDLTHFTYDDQVEFACETYPKREGITTRLISGNHDIEGEFGKLGANPVQAVANQRADIEFLGDYSAHIELPNGAHAQLVHGRGGGSYAVSYKPQKYVEGLPPGRKPAVIVFGHWHIAGLFRHRNVTCVLGGCFERQTPLLVRLGLQPDVGFWALTLRLADDASLVGVIPEWVPIYEGREAT